MNCVAAGDGRLLDVGVAGHRAPTVQLGAPELDQDDPELDPDRDPAAARVAAPRRSET